MTLDEYNRHWIMAMSTAHDVESLASWVVDAQQSEHWNGKLAQHAAALLVDLWRRVVPYDEASVRADERLKVLREVRKVASSMDHDPANDPYTWGYGGSRIVAMLTAKLAEERDRQGIQGS